VLEGKMRDMFEEMEQVRREMESILGNVFGHSGNQLLKHPKSKLVSCGARNAFSDLKETDTSVNASFEMPGVDKKDIEVNVKEGLIEVKAFKNAEVQQVKKDKCESSSCRSIRFYKALQLPCKVDPDKVSASYKDGILLVEMPKMEIQKHKKIEIQ
jgi:HSP20 family protein